MTDGWEIVVGAEFDGERIDRFLRRVGYAGSRSALSDALQAGAIRINGQRVKKGHALRAGDRVTGPRAPESSAATADAEVQLEVLYEDAWLVAVNKPAHVPTHPLRGGEGGTLASGLLARYPEMARVGHGPLEPGILHRLDTETSGIVLAARDPKTFGALHAAHRGGQLNKRYLALCSGQLQAPARIHGHLRADQRRVRVAAAPFEGSRPIVTELVSAEPHAEFSLVQVSVPFAARHQVRAQLAALGHPIAADKLYGGSPLAGLVRQFLHASALSCVHPATGARLQLACALPDELSRVLAALVAGGSAF